MEKKSKMLIIRRLVVFSIVIGAISCTTSNPPVIQTVNQPVNTTTGATKTK